ncbi:methionyl-tRNA formyltransferase [Buchnera aphidicola]|uniref:methionyl-tRNA formyltransferase n=1 Tax=Buchnera aphidicola TaxID=9 RepID=UPI003464D472
MISFPKKNTKKYKKLRIIFAGTPDFAAQHLYALISSKHTVITVLTKPDHSSSRRQKNFFSPVKIIAKNHSIPLLQPISLNTLDIQEILRKLNADIMLVVAYGIILPNIILNLFPLGCINVHASLLPRWRGPAPIQWAILNGDKQTGISIIQMDQGIDTGKILYSTPCAITSNDTSASLEKKLILIGIKSMLIVLDRYNFNTNTYIIQNDINATYASKIKKEQGRLNWHTSAEKIERLIRAFNPYPISFFLIKNQFIKVWQANVCYGCNKNKKIGEIIICNKNGIQINTVNNILNITKLQIPGKKIISTLDFLNSKKKWFLPGTKLD